MKVTDERTGANGGERSEGRRIEGRNGLEETHGREREEGMEREKITEK